MENKKLRYLTLEEFAECCGVTLEIVQKWAKRGVIKPMKVCRSKEYKIGIDNFKKIKFEKKESSFYLRPHEKNQLKVLIIDDEKDIIDSISPLFSANGFQVCSSTDAYDAMSLLRTERPVILTLDLQLVDSNGIEVLKMINDLGLNQNVWVIIISAASDSELKSAVDFGADFYLQKPFHENDLDKIIKKISLSFKNKAA